VKVGGKNQIRIRCGDLRRGAASRLRQQQKQHDYGELARHDDFGAELIRARLNHSRHISEWGRVSHCQVEQAGHDSGGGA
jgi:hypothetical protein